jgi:hypothetical protein
MQSQHQEDAQYKIRKTRCPHALEKATWESGRIGPLTLNHDIRQRQAINFMPQPLYPQGESPWYPLKHENYAKF